MKFNADFESRLDGICRSDLFQAWRERLTVCWDQKPAKDAVILEAREAIAADGAGLSKQEASNLRRAAISRLIGGALQAMNRSGASPEAGRAWPSRQDLEMLVIRKSPTRLRVLTGG